MEYPFVYAFRWPVHNFSMYCTTKGVYRKGASVYICTYVCVCGGGGENVITDQFSRNQPITSGGYVLFVGSNKLLGILDVPSLYADQAPVITNVHTQTVTSGSKIPMHSSVASPQNMVSTSSYSYDDEVFHRNTLTQPQRPYYVRRPGIDSSRTLAKKAPVLVHSPPHTVTR